MQQQRNFRCDVTFFAPPYDNSRFKRVQSTNAVLLEHCLPSTHRSDSYVFFLLAVPRLSADNRYRPIIGRLFTLLRIYDTQIKIDTHTFWFEWMGKCFSVVRRQDSGTVRAGPNRILEFPWGRKLFILHRPLNKGTGWGRAVTKNYKLVKLRQECYRSTIIPLWLHNRYNMTFIDRRCVLK